MKRLIVVLSGLLVLPAFAEVAPDYYYEEIMAQYSDEIPESISESEDTTINDSQSNAQEAVTPVVPTAVSPRNTNGRSATSRAITSATTSSRNIATRNVSNANTARTVNTRQTTTNAQPSSSSRSAVSRASGTTVSGTARQTATTTIASRPTTTVKSTGNTTASQSGLTTRSASNANKANTTRASVVQTDTVNSPLYISSSRVGVNTTSNVTSRVPTVRVGSTTTTTSESTSTATSIDELAQLTDYCKAQYVACMDNFCNVLDENQGRCSCSSNLSNYAETENALKKATESLQDVATQIQYIGLTADEVESLFTQTEAELEMQTTTDSSQLKSALDKIKDMIVSVEPSSASSSSNNLNFDLSGLLDFSIDSMGFDLSSFLGTSNNTNSISNQRGEQLYDTAMARCKASVLNSCAAQGVDITVITNSYDLEIDKACIAYEKSLTESNDQMAATVRNANTVLQRARLLVAQQKNAYDLRGCVNELDACMQDEFVCGDDYENCLDPSGKYIVNGEVVVGSQPGTPGSKDAPIYSTWKYSNDQKYAWGSTETEGTLSDYITTTVTANSAEKTSTNMSEFLQNKIGYNKDGKNYGMCVSVLNKCQDITYEGTGQNTKYNQNNNVVKEFLNRTLIQIKASQDTILADYAENCITDVATCLAQNNYDADDNEDGKLSSGNKLAIKACNPIITTCMSVNSVSGTASTTELNPDEWIIQIMD